MLRWSLFLLILVGGGNCLKQQNIVLQLAKDYLMLVLHIASKSNL
ncbi:hypothetical protein ECP03047993_5722 [Escherichia coli P0304799.3]|nr:hypothetical protein ECP03047993_5722 [Escherichia coli P0304799.3]